MRTRSRNIIIAAAATAALAGTGTGFAVTSTGGGAVTPPVEAVLQSDGYPAVLNLTPAEVTQFAGSQYSGMTQYITHLGYGERSGNQEIVVQLTDNGVQTVKAQVAANGTPAGVTSIHWVGNDLVVDMPFSG